MSTTYEIPLISGPQIFTARLGTTQYTLKVYWSTVANCWNIDILDADGLVEILTGVALVAGADLLGQYPHLGFGGVLLVTSEGDPFSTPPYASLGSTSKLLFITP